MSLLSSATFHNRFNTTKPTVLNAHSASLHLQNNFRPKVQNLNLVAESKRSYNHWYEQNRKHRWRYFRRDLDDLTFTQACYGIIGTLVAVYVLRNVVPGFPKLSFSFANHPWISAVTAMFDHHDFHHLFANSLFLWCLTSVFPGGITGIATLSIFFLGGLAGTGVIALVNKARLETAIRERNPIKYNNVYFKSYLGASAAIYAITVVQTLINPFGSASLYGIIPMKNWVFLAGMVAFDLYGLLSETKYKHSSNGSSTTSHLGHLSGAAFGAVAYAVMRRFRIGFSYY
ncbi:hypothetical protein V1514DRAFT_345274 [Lipomyces japonicus]|uniref:uncharacterized protein n=1 Tax=Lipomyces japonicus TaxID=56871 RepID=UPI0034CEC87B